MVSDGLVHAYVETTHVFSPILISRKVDGSIRASANLLFDGVLVDVMLRCSILIVISVLHTSIQCFLSE